MDNFTLAVLVNKKVLTKDEAEALSEQLPKIIHPTKLGSAQPIIKDILDKVNE